MNGLSRLTTLLMVSAIASIAAAGRSTHGAIGGATSFRAPKTNAPSASVGGRSYGALKFGSTAAYKRHAKKRANVIRHRVACR